MNIDKKAIRSDKYLQWMLKLGLPIALIAIASLWLGRYLSSPGIGLLFFITMPVALVLGFAYNIRYIILARRQNPQPPAKH